MCIIELLVRGTYREGKEQMATIWESRIDSDDFDLEHLTKEQLEELADQLDTVVMAVCQDWGLGQ